MRGGPSFGATVLARRGASETALSMVPVEFDTRPEMTFVTAAHKANFASLVAAPELAREMVRLALTQTSKGFFELGVLPLLEALVRLRMHDEMDAYLELARSQSSAAVIIGPAIDRAEAILGLQLDDRVVAERKLRAALATFKKLETPFEIAQTEMLLAPLVDDPEGAEMLAHAVAQYEALGAEPYAEQARTAAGASGKPLAR